MYNAWRGERVHTVGEEIIRREVKLQKTPFINFVDSKRHIDLITIPLKIINTQQLYTDHTLRKEECCYCIRAYAYYIKYRKTVVYSPIFLSSEQILKINII